MPDLRVVSERSAKEMQQLGATRALKAALIDLTANLLRVIRGVGKPELLLDQMAAFADAHLRYSSAHDHEPFPGAYHTMLRFRHPDFDHDDERADVFLKEQAVCNDALQVIASTLLNQNLQAAGALNEFRSALYAWERERKSRNRPLKSKTALPKHTLRNITEGTKRALRKTQDFDLKNYKSIFDKPKS